MALFPLLLFETSHGYDPGYIFPVDCWDLPIASIGCRGSSSLSHSERYPCFTSSHDINPSSSHMLMISRGDMSTCRGIPGTPYLILPGRFWGLAGLITMYPLCIRCPAFGYSRILCENRDGTFPLPSPVNPSLHKQ